MPVKVRVPGPLRRLTSGESVVEVEGATVGEVLNSLESSYPGFRERIYDAEGNLRQFVNIYKNDEDIRFGSGLETEITAGDDISIVPAVAGGKDPGP
jgi:MoaD family protein